MSDKTYPWWTLLLIVFVFVLLLIFMIVYVARNTAFPLSGGSVDSGIIAAKTLRKSNKSPTTNNYKLCAVIVEPRTINLVETIENYLHILPDYTHFQVYHGTKNEAYLHNSSLSKHIESGKIELLNMGVENLTISGYSKLFCSIDFWDTIPSEKVLIFQTDSITCSQSPYDIEDFMVYDFIGAPYHTYINMGIRLLFLLKGWNTEGILFNGGLSLRSKSKSIEVLRQYPWDEKTPEDVWFCAFMPKVNATLPDLQTAQKFAYESRSDFNYVPFGLHKPRRNKRSLENYCPEHKKIPFLPSHTDYKTLYFV